MKNLILQLHLALSGCRIFQDKYLCNREVAVQRFASSLEEARKYYAANSRVKISAELIHKSWQHNIAELESYFVNAMDAGFMSNRVVNGTMVFTNQEACRIELASLYTALGWDQTVKVISGNLNAEFLAGKSRRATFINSTHHLYHLAQFERITSKQISHIKSVIEFGGGYGNMARVVHNMASCETYQIVDLLLFSCIQYVFLSTVLGNGKAAFHDANPENIATVVLHPLYRSDQPAVMNGELFLSTWALSESTRTTYEWVLSHNWFGASSLLLAYNAHWIPWQVGELEDTLTRSGWRVYSEPIAFLPGSSYLFATR